jgi:CrcB protein
MQPQFSIAALAAIGAGGAAGSVARYVLGTLLQRPDSRLPYGTLLVNVTGSFALGLLISVLATRTSSPELRLFLTIGLCGGYTTFSSFALESSAFIQDGRMVRLLVYVMLSVSLTIAAMVAGLSAGRMIVR